MFLMASCSRPDQPPLCGESFCLPRGAKLISRQSPVHDFNLYRVEWNGDRFLIYEGNHPQRSKGSVVLEMRKDWPNYLQVSGACATPDHCAVKSFATELTRR
jgi:hypothetical protein